MVLHTKGQRAKKEELPQIRREMLSEIRVAIDLEPEIAAYHYALWVTLDELGWHETALPEIQKAVDLEPDTAEYHYSLGLALHKLERYDESLVQFQEAAMLDSAYESEYQKYFSIMLRFSRR